MRLVAPFSGLLSRFEAKTPRGNAHADKAEGKESPAASGSISRTAPPLTKISRKTTAKSP